jgi:hypothetical protein
MSPAAKKFLPHIALAAMLITAIIYLRIQGRVWWCQQGDYWPISLAVNSPHNSQHLFDSYSLTHILHGILFFGLFWLLRRRINFPWRFVAAAAIEIAWEMMENSPIIINRYRAATISFGYEGDSIFNSLGDIASFMLGFYLARRLGLWRSVFVFLFVEIALLLTIRDNLALNVLMLLWPIDAIRHWQAGA